MRRKIPRLSMFSMASSTLTNSRKKCSSSRPVISLTTQNKRLLMPKQPSKFRLMLMRRMPSQIILLWPVRITPTQNQRIGVKSLTLKIGKSVLMESIKFPSTRERQTRGLISLELMRFSRVFLLQQSVTIT